MITAFLEGGPAVPVRAAVAVGTHHHRPLPPGVEWLPSAHPVPDARSVAAARRALDLAGRVPEDEECLLLLSGGASALLAAPIDGVALADKQATVRTLLAAGADIHALNTVRKHLSAIKGGRLAAACRGRLATLAISDVAGDDLRVIGSVPGVPYPSTWNDVSALLARFGGDAAYPQAVVDATRRGVAGDLPDTPKPGDPRLARATARVLGGRAQAMAAAAAAAAGRGYRVIVADAAVTGEARERAPRWLDEAIAAAASGGGPACVVSSGETTVRVNGRGRGGRNQEFALALAAGLARRGGTAPAASLGTDGIDGPTDAAGAIVDATTLARARAAGVDAHDHLARNDAYAFFDAIGDLVRTGPTDTNVGDLQILLLP